MEIERWQFKKIVKILEEIRDKLSTLDEIKDKLDDLKRYTK